MKSKLAHGCLLLAFGVVFGLSGSSAEAQSNPAPLINQPLVPDAAVPGGAGFTLIVNGTGFVAGSVVDWNGSARPTAFVSGSQLTAAITAEDIAVAATAFVTVNSPGPGGGASNVDYFSITKPTLSIDTTLFSSVATGSITFTVVAGDFNGDGKLDLAVLDECGNADHCVTDGTVFILLGDGLGNFTLASTISAGFLPSALALGDFNGDGHLDVAAVASGDSEVVVMLGDGTGHFTKGPRAITGVNPQSIAVGDFNGDGNLDFAVTNRNDATISILLGDGTGRFHRGPVLNDAGIEPQGIAVGDFNNDGNLDLVSTDEYTGALLTFLGDGTGHFTLASSVATGVVPFSVVVGDFNGDGKLDAAVLNLCGNDVKCSVGSVSTASIFLGDGTGNFSLASSPETGIQSVYMAVGDLNGDGRLDLAVVNACGNNPLCNYQSPGTVTLLLGDGTGNFTLSGSALTGRYQGEGVALGDFNGDGKMDIAATSAGDTVSILLQPDTTVSVAPIGLTYPAQLVHTTSAPQDVILTNSGTATLNISSIFAIGNFSQTNTCGSSVAPAASCTVSLSFTPGGKGEKIGTLGIGDNANGSPQTVNLAGIGTVVQLTPDALNFGMEMVGITSAPQTITLTNKGLAITIVKINTSGTNQGDFAQTNTCGTVVASGASCTVSVTFTPRALGPRTAFVTLADTGGGSPQKIALSGTGT